MKEETSLTQQLKCTMLCFNKLEFSMVPVNHASWLYAWDRGLIVFASIAMLLEGKEPKSTPFLLRLSSHQRP